MCAGRSCRARSARCRRSPSAAALSLPGSTPVIRITMFRDGPRAGIARIRAALDDGFQRLAAVLNAIDAAREMILGH